MTVGSGSARSTYPVLTEPSRAAVAARLVEIVTLRHPEGLAPHQLDEVMASVESQLRATERLHQFVLTNADEPAFTMPESSGGAR